MVIGRSVNSGMNTMAPKPNGFGSINDNANGFLEGVSAAELKMIHRLAGNDAVIRNKTMRKLRKWLQAIADKVPDSSDGRILITPNFMRVWKALFFCMWMADKPLYQEQLAEKMSDLVLLFSSKPNIMFAFVEWFFRTMAREWPWIDRFRLDKFMMLFRRVLRKCLQQVCQNQVFSTNCEMFTKILSVYIFNHRTSTTPKKSKQLRRDFETEIKAPLGLQIHLIDIFLEELAKVSQDNKLTHSRIMKLLQPFLHEILTSDDQRLLDEIHVRIFQHLIQQSDVVIDDLMGITRSNDVEDDDENENDDEEDDDDDDEDMSRFASTLDPRPGVDVTLPQLPINYEKLSQKISELMRQKKCRMANRKILLKIGRQLKEVLIGQNPFAIEEVGRKPGVSRKMLQKSTSNLVRDLDEEYGSKKKKRATRKQRLNKSRQPVDMCENSNDSVCSEDNNTYLQDDELLEHLSDNYLSYLHEEMTNPENDAGADGLQNHESSGRKKRKRDEDQEQQSEIMVRIPKKKSKKNENLRSNDQEQSNMTPSNTTPKTPSMPAPASSTPASFKKRVNFVMAKNLHHDHSDYPQSIKRSPAIPFDKEKKPRFGLLKSPLVTPSSSSTSSKVSPNTAKNSRRAASFSGRSIAEDFF